MATQTGALSLDDRLGNIERDISDLSGKIDKVLDGLKAGETRFTVIEQQLAMLSGRVTKLEEGRDAVIRLIVFAVMVALLGLIGLKAAG
jgi:hypothetical protein